MTKTATGVVLAASLMLTGRQSSEPAAEAPRYPTGPATMTAGANPGSGFDITIRSVVEAAGMPEVAVAYWQQALGEMVETPAWRQIAQRNHFTTTFATGDEFQTFLANTQADVKAALRGQGR